MSLGPKNGEDLLPRTGYSENFVRSNVGNQRTSARGYIFDILNTHVVYSSLNCYCERIGQIPSSHLVEGNSILPVMIFPVFRTWQKNTYGNNHVWHRIAFVLGILWSPVILPPHPSKYRKYDDQVNSFLHTDYLQSYTLLLNQVNSFLFFLVAILY